MFNKLYFIEINEEIDFRQYNQYLKILLPDKQALIKSLRYEIDKKLSLISEMFVRYIVWKILEVNNSDIILSKNNYGKPFLVGFPDFQFNISHTRCAIVIGFSEKPIGIDIEKINIADLTIAELFFSENELNYILSDQQQQNKLFYEVWTKKESYIKWLGKGLSIPLATFDIISNELDELFNLIHIDNYLISVCSENIYGERDMISLSEYQTIQLLSEYNFVKL